MGDLFDRHPFDARERVVLELSVAEAAALGRGVCLAAEVLGVVPLFGGAVVVSAHGSEVRGLEHLAKLIASTIDEHRATRAKLAAAQREFEAAAQ